MAHVCTQMADTVYPTRCSPRAVAIIVVVVVVPPTHISPRHALVMEESVP
jgi:hypothetical protein